MNTYNNINIIKHFSKQVKYQFIKLSIDLYFKLFNVKDIKLT